MIAAWIMWAHFFLWEPTSAIEEHASLFTWRQRADSLNRTARQIADEYNTHGGPNPYRDMFDQPYSWWSQSHIPKQRR